MAERVMVSFCETERIMRSVSQKYTITLSAYDIESHNDYASRCRRL